MPVPAEAQDLVRNPLLEAEAPVVKDEKPSALQKMAALQKKKAELQKGREESKTTENPIRNVRVVQAKSPAKSDASGSSDDSSTDDEGPRDLLTGR